MIQNGSVSLRGASAQESVDRISPNFLPTEDGKGPALMDHSEELKYLIGTMVEGTREMTEEFRRGNNEMSHLRIEVKKLSEGLDPLMHTILGNGGPGVLTRLALVEQESKLRDQRQDEKLKELGDRADKQDGRRWQLMVVGVTGVIGFIVSVLHWVLKI